MATGGGGVPGDGPERAGRPGPLPAGDGLAWPRPDDGPASEESVRSLAWRLAEYTRHIENLNIAEYVALVRNPKRMFLLNFISGIGRGFGIAVGFTLLGALALGLLRYLVALNLPVIGGFIADLVRIVQDRLKGP
ncbi:MAG: DUF5665 domain-containing protein [Firmicutes bacterium]|nr:DUF5665 domain-containing protein [Bacillota bacterium]